MQPEKQLEKLHDLLESLNKGNATEEDTIRLFELTIKAVESVRTQVLEQMGTLLLKGTQPLSESQNQVLLEVDSLNDRLKSLADTVRANKTALTQDLNNSFIQVFKELRRIEGTIPSVPKMPDLEPLQIQIRGLRQAINDIKTPEPLEATDVREKLESLKGDERLDASAIKNLPKEKAGKGGGYAHAIGGRNIEVLGSVINLNIPVQTTAPANPVVNELWIDIS